MSAAPVRGAPRLGLRFGLAFPLVAASLLGALLFVGPVVATRERVVDGTVTAATVLMPLVGYEVRRDARDPRVLRAADGHGVRIAPECDGLPAVLIFLAAVAVSPVPWRRRVLFGSLGSLALLLLNQVRIGHLLWLSDRAPDAFHDAHEAWWPTGLVAAAGLLYLVWARCSAGART